MKVYIPNQGGHDYSDAERFGSLTYITQGAISKFSVGTMAREWSKYLSESSPDDMILLSSLTTLCVIGCSLFARKHGHINLLLFRNGKYIRRTIVLDELLNYEKGVLN